MGNQGSPCWYELNTGDLDAAGAFYGKVFGWRVADSGMEGFDYHLARTADDAMVAGMMKDDAARWLIYFATDDCDAMVKAVVEKGGKVASRPVDIPGTGRYAVVSDPQGAAFALMQPDMSTMSPEEVARAKANAPFDRDRPGHCQWNELMSPDPVAGFDFYAALFGWTKGEAIPMGETGDYQLFRHEGRDIGAMMGLGEAPKPLWLPYFGASMPMGRLVEVIEAAGGKVHHGPVEVPGPEWIVVASDPQGAAFAAIGPQR